MTSQTIIESFELNLKACVREVPGKRRVFKGTWGSQESYIKIFEHPSSAQRHFDREINGLEIFHSNNILTPKVLWSGTLPKIATEGIKNGSYAIITQAIPDSYSFNEFFENTNNKSQAILNLFKTVLNHHKSNFIQTDLHPGNFLVSDGKFYSLDADALKETKSEEDKLDNIALLFSQFPVQDHELLLNAYSKLSPVSNSLEQRIFIRRAKRCSKYLKKVFRQCTEIEHISQASHKAWIKRDFLDKKIVEATTNPETLFPTDPEKLLKNGNTASVALANIGSLEVVIKRNNFNKNFKTFIRRFRKSRAAISWKNAFRLINYGLQTPQPVALVENKIGPMLRQAYIITEKCCGPDALEYFRENADEAIADEMLTIFKVFEKCQITHGDCKATNFIIAKNKVFIIDLDAMREHKSHETFKKYFKKDLKRWMANWQDSPDTMRLFEEKIQQANLSKYLETN